MIGTPRGRLTLYHGQCCWLRSHVLSSMRCLPTDMSATMHISDSHFWALDGCLSRGVLSFEERASLARNIAILPRGPSFKRTCYLARLVSCVGVLSAERFPIHTAIEGRLEAQGRWKLLQHCSSDAIAGWQKARGLGTQQPSL